MTTAMMVLIAFLIGSFPTGVLLTRLVTHEDVRELGSGNVGAANVARAVGMKLGIGVALVDIAKGVIPVLVARGFGLDHRALVLVAFAAVLGHDCSIFLRFRGGKGVATTLGVALALGPVPALVAIVVWIAVMLLWRYSSLASLASLAALPALLVLGRQPPEYAWLAVALFVLGALKHWENIGRLVNGTERKFGTRRATGG